MRTASESSGRGLAEAYAARLAHHYKRVVARAEAAAGAEIAQQAERLCLALQGVPISAADLATLRNVAAKASSPRKRDMPVIEALSMLRRAAANADATIGAAAGQLAEALNRFDAMIAAVRQHAADNTYDADGPAAAVSTFCVEVRGRCLRLVDTLAEKRYDSAEYRRLLIDELLDRTKLALLLTEQSEAGFRRQKESWQALLARWGLTLEESPKRAAFELDLLLDHFLAPVQLTYDRPGVLKSVLQAFGRNKFQEKLVAEVEAGLQRLQPQILAMLQADWQAAQSGWLGLAEATIQHWLVAETGSDSSAGRAQLAAWQEKRAVIASTLQRLGDISAVSAISAWREQIRKGAATRLTRRLTAEAQRRAT